MPCPCFNCRDILGKLLHLFLLSCGGSQPGRRCFLVLPSLVDEFIPNLMNLSPTLMNLSPLGAPHTSTVAPTLLPRCPVSLGKEDQPEGKSKTSCPQNNNFPFPAVAISSFCSPFPPLQLLPRCRPLALAVLSLIYDSSASLVTFVLPEEVKPQPRGDTAQPDRGRNGA